MHDTMLENMKRGGQGRETQKSKKSENVFVTESQEVITRLLTRAIDGLGPINLIQLHQTLQRK